MTNTWQKTLAIFTNRKMLVIFLLGISSGLPLLLTSSTLGFWLEESKVSLANIGAMALVGSFYALKFLWSPVVDIVKIPLLSRIFGRRRGWLLFTQIMLMLSIFGLASTNPAESLLPVVIFSLAIAFFSATQDIVVDGYRIDILSAEEQAAGSVPSVYGYRVGMYLAGAVGLLLSAHFSWNVVYAIFGGCVMIGVLGTLLGTEPEFKTQRKLSVIAPFADFMTRKNWIILLLFIIAYKFSGAFMGGGLMSSFYLKMDFSKEEIALAVKTFGFFATILGLFVGGLLATKIGIVKILWIDIILSALTNLLFIPIIYNQGNLFLLTLAVSVDNFVTSIGTVALVAFLSILCNKQYSATQYALLSSLASLGRIVLAANSGWIVEDIGWTNFYILTCASALPALLLMPRIAKYLAINLDAQQQK